MKRKILFILLVFICLWGTPEIYAYCDTGVIFIGDERTVLMDSHIAINDNFYVAEVGAGYDYLIDDAKSGMTSIIASNHDIKNWKIISCFGANDLSNSLSYLDYYKVLTSKLPVGYNYTLYLAPVFKIDDTSIDSVNAFNEGLKGIADNRSIIYLSTLAEESVQNEIANYKMSNSLGYSPDGSRILYEKIASAAGVSVGGSPTINSEQAKLLLDKINKEMDRSADYSTLVSVYSALKTTGFSDYECAAILVNMNRECSIVPDAGQSSGGAIGLIQWDGGRRDNLQKFSEDLGDIKYTVKGYKIGGIGTQVAFILEELLNQNQWGGVAPCNPNYYTNFNYDEAKKAVNDSSIDLSKTVTVDEWRSMSNVVAMSLYFTSQFERCAYRIDIFNVGAKQSPDMYSVVTGCDPTNDSNASLNQELADALFSSGLWDEEKFLSFSQLVEEPLIMPTRDELSQEQLQGVVNWKDNIKNENENVFLKFIRKVVMLFGILFIVWVVLIYLCYWLDRINNFIDIEFLPIITAGRLKVSPEENECTFSPKSVTKGQVQTVNHRTIIGVCLVGIFFAVFTLSGTLYTTLNFLVRTILSWLGV